MDNQAYNSNGLTDEQRKSLEKRDWRDKVLWLFGQGDYHQERQRQDFLDENERQRQMSGLAQQKRKQGIIDQAMAEVQVPYQMGQTGYDPTMGQRMGMLSGAINGLGSYGLSGPVRRVRR